MIRSHEKSCKTLVVVVAIALGLAIALVGRRPILLSYSDPRELRRPIFAILNPLRHLEPEQAAVAVLDDLQRGDVLSAFKRVHSADPLSPSLYAKEQQYPLRRWKLVDRDDDAGHATLRYHASRATSNRMDWEITMKVEIQHDRWIVTVFDAAY